VRCPPLLPRAPPHPPVLAIRADEKKKKDTVCVTLPFNIECTACHRKMNKGLKINGRKTLGPDPGDGHIELFHVPCKGCKAVITLKRDDNLDEGFSIHKGATRNRGQGRFAGPPSTNLLASPGAVVKDPAAAQPAFVPAASSSSSAAARLDDDNVDEQAALDLLRDEMEVRAAFSSGKSAPPLPPQPAKKLKKGEIDPALLEYE
jgi:hypothetical protein